MFPSLPSPEQVVSIVIFAATDNVQACGEHHFGLSNTLLLAWNARGFGKLLHWLETAPDDLTTCSALCNEITC